MKHVFLAILVAATAAQCADLQPLMAQPDVVVQQDDFATAGAVDKTLWGARQGTQWVIADGVLRGKPSTPEFQAKRKDHFGYEPRISAPKTPQQFILKFSVRFEGGGETSIVPFIEFGHHVCRLHLTKDGSEMVADHESVKVAESKDLKLESGKWYHVLAEMKGDEVVVQFADGPTFYAKHESFAKPNESGASGLGIAGPKDGVAEIDNVTIWSIKPEAQATWAAKRDALPKIEPTPIVKAKPAAKGKGKAKK
ncbi:MAG: hypothetical protein KDK97_03835 [Verrucomicrobiales bacterium]|nr:hypothetical protein [Verrucomicrobiales bacterium]MCP5559602.1 hypothetical protein [Verrucomicrobiaceae bacterium]